MKKILAFMAIAIFTNLKAQVCFNPITTFTSGGTQPVSICSADFNLDGKLDLATSNDNAGTISIYLGNGLGTFTTFATYTSGSAPYNIMSADFNTDGKPDLVTANGLSGNVSVYIGTGTGSFSAAVNYATGGWPSDVCSADFNGDGKLDIACTNNTSNNFSILLGTGLGTFSTALNYGSGGSGPLTILTGDFNSDSKFDLAITNRLSSNIAIHLGTGSGTFSTAVTYTTPSLPTGGFAADFNSDNILDIVSVGNTTTLVTVFLGTGTGSFSPSTNYPASIFQSAISADFNMDGKKDIAGVGSNTIGILLGTGTGSFGAVTIYTTVGNNTNELVSADFDANGKNDLAVTNYNSNSITLLLNSIPSISVTSTGTICSGSSATLTASGATTYTWSNSATGSLTVVTPSVTTNYSLTGTTSGGCVYSTSRSITVNPVPSLTISSLNSICIGNSVNISVTGALSYSWSTGASSASINVSPTITTSYSVIGTGTNGCSNSASKSITVNPLPTITITGPGTVCATFSASLLASGASSYTWSTNSNSPSIVITPTFHTTYSVTGTDLNGCSNTASKFIQLEVPPIVSIISSSIGPLSICIGATVYLLANGASTYTWSTNTNSPVMIVSPTVTTTYSLIGMTAAGCTNIDSRIISVHPLPTLTISSPNVICSENTVSLSASGASTYTWNTNSTASIIVVSPTVSSSYTVIGTDVNGCNNSATKSITVNPLPVLTLSGPNAICVGNTASLSVAGASTYSWSTSSTGSSIAVSPTVTSNYSVIGTNVYGCNNSATKSITVNPLPVLTLSGPNAICVGNTASLSAAGASTYSWSTSSTASNIVVNPTVTTSYSVVGTDNNSCSSSASKQITVNPLPLINIISSSNIICKGETAILNAAGATSFTWNTNQIGSTITISPTITSTYSVSGTNMNGCSSSAAITQTVSDCTGFEKLSNEAMAKVLIFPNPNNGEFTINSNADVSLHIINGLGQSIAIINLDENNNRQTLITNLSPGIYFFITQNSKLKVIVK